jgi:hypothetical protein
MGKRKTFLPILRLRNNREGELKGADPFAMRSSVNVNVIPRSLYRGACAPALLSRASIWRLVDSLIVELEEKKKVDKDINVGTIRCNKDLERFSRV